jgi:hypothetical protein
MPFWRPRTVGGCKRMQADDRITGCGVRHEGVRVRRSPGMSGGCPPGAHAQWAAACACTDNRTLDGHTPDAQAQWAATGACTDNRTKGCAVRRSFTLQWVRVRRSPGMPSWRPRTVGGCRHMEKQLILSRCHDVHVTKTPQPCKAWRAPQQAAQRCCMGTSMHH